MAENERKDEKTGESGGKPQKKLRVLLRTFGCQMNVRDSEVIAGLLRKAGYALADDEQGADVVIFVTCSVRQHAEDKVWSEIGRIAKKRGTRDEGRPTSNVQRPTSHVARNTRPIIGLAGCVAQQYKETAFKRAPMLDFVVGPADIEKIPGIIKELSAFSRQPSAKELFETKIWETDGSSRPEEIYHTGYHEDKEHAYVVISEGCINFCSYCVVPYVRVGLRHRDCGEIVKEIEGAVTKGITSITLLGQNVNAYKVTRSQDTKSQVTSKAHSPQPKAQSLGFAELLCMVNDIPGLTEFNFVTSHPKDASEELFKTMAGCDKLKQYFHLPLQSGSDRILKLMKRGYTASHYLKLAETYRKILPEGKISTDIIVGFPGETKRDFQDTLDMMKKIKFDSAYIFKYSPRPGTEAAGFEDDVPKAEKERRHKILLDYQKQLHLKRKKDFA